MADQPPHDDALDVEGPNESAPGDFPPGHPLAGQPHPSEAPPHDDALDVEGPNEGAEGHRPGAP